MKMKVICVVLAASVIGEGVILYNSHTNSVKMMERYEHTLSKCENLITELENDNTDMESQIIELKNSIDEMYYQSDGLNERINDIIYINNLQYDSEG